MKLPRRKSRPTFRNPLRSFRLPFRSPLALRERPKAKPGRPLPRSGASLSRLRPWQAEFWRELGKQVRQRWSWRKFLIGLGVFVGVMVIGTSALFAYYVRDLPNPHVIQERQITQSTQIFDRTGTHELYNFHGDENRTVVTSDQISTYAKQATVSLEDSTFYKNHGFDVRGIARAVVARIPLVNRLLPSGELAGGGSTITQQYIKNALLINSSTGVADNSLSRKVKELILAIEVGRSYGKDDILTGYLNQIPYGNQAYGIEAASETYFNKHAKDLTLAQAATLASIPQAPTYYSPYGDNLDQLFTRKDYTLDRMVKAGYITQDQADQAKKDAPNAEHPDFAQANSSLLAPHFVFYVRQQLISTLYGNVDQQTAERELDQAGYKVITSLDYDTQTMAQQVVAELGPKMVKSYNASNAALVAVDPTNGQVLAMVGSIDYNNSTSGQTNFATALLQPGSSFKPFVYATQFDEKHKSFPGAVTYDLTTNFGTDAQPYKPNDYDLQQRGPITNRLALAGSLNIPAVKNLYLAGIPDSIATAKALGIDTLNADTSHYGLSLVLGSGEVQPVEMANAYASFANGGKHYPLTPILKIQKADGSTVKDFTQNVQPSQAITPEVSYEIASVLSDADAKRPVFRSLTDNLTLSDRPVGSKTGTTENNRDGWTVGFTPQVSVAVWVGNNLPNKTMTKGADGSVVAGPIWHSFMSQYMKGKPVQQFTRPSDIKDVTIDKLSGKLPSDQTPDNDKITDIFAPWQVPTTQDDVHVKVSVDKVSGKLATSLTPADQIDTKYFCHVHSEVPSNPNWEGPVQAWAQSNGCTGTPPTDQDDVHTAANQPTVGILSPANNATVSGVFTILATVGGPSQITKAEFFINGTSIGTVTQAPWSVSYDASQLPAGSQVISVTATNSLELTQTAQITVNSATPSPTASATPAPVTGLTATPTAVSKAASKTIHLAWTEPATGVTKANIYESSTPAAADTGTLIKSQPATPGASESLDIDVSALTAGKVYYFQVRPVSAAGAENTAGSKVAVSVLP